MTRPLTIKTIMEIQEYREHIIRHLEHNVDTLTELLKCQDTLTIFERLKFDKIGTEPLTGEPENLIEVINQCHTYLVSIMAAEYLLNKYPHQEFIINCGNLPGYDIESADKTIIAECFAATSYKSNGKLAADLKRLASNETATRKFEFFYDKEFTEEHKVYYQHKYPDIQIIKYQKLK